MEIQGAASLIYITAALWNSRQPVVTYDEPFVPVLSGNILNAHTEYEADHQKQKNIGRTS